MRATTMAVVYLGTLLIDQRTSPRAHWPWRRRSFSPQPAGARRPGLPADLRRHDRDRRRRAGITAAAGGPRLLRPAVALHRCVRGHGSGAAAARPALLLPRDRGGSAVQLRGGAADVRSCRSAAWRPSRRPRCFRRSRMRRAGSPHAAARGLVSSAALVHVVPWLTWRVPSPPLWLVAVYYVGLVAFVSVRCVGAVDDPVAPRRASGGRSPHRGERAPHGRPHPCHHGRDRGRLRLVVLDVGQGDATMVRFPSGPHASR